MNVHNYCFFLRHLNGAVLETLSRPSLLITDSFNAINVQARRRERDTQLMSRIFMKIINNNVKLLLRLLHVCSTKS